MRLISSDDKVAAVTEDTLFELQAKHPSHQDNPNFSAPPDLCANDHITVSVEEVQRAVTSFPAGSAGGMDGLRPQHLKDLLCITNGEAADNLCVALGQLSDIMLSGKVPAEIVPCLYGASLTALSKKDGGIRPIAVGNTFRRLVAKIGSKRVQYAMGSQLRPHQLGYGTKGGAEAAVHAVRRYIQSEWTEPRAIVKLDFQNAFNMIHRDRMLNVVKEHIPSLYPFIWQCYRTATFLSFGHHIILSSSGVQQGDPLGPLLFCLLTQDLIVKLKSELNVWYLDDGTLGGTVDSVLSDIETIKASASLFGLELNTGKCEVFFLANDVSIVNQLQTKFQICTPNIRFPRPENLTLLGAPLTNEAIPNCIKRRHTAAQLMVERLPTLPAHPALYLLKNCLSLPKLLYILRTSPTWRCVEDLRHFDKLIQTATEELTNVKMSTQTWTQASLPVSYGGIGLRRSEDVAIPAFLASTFSVSNLITSILPDPVKTYVDPNVEEAITNWKLLSSQTCPEDDQKGIQKEWDVPCIKTVFENLLSSQSDMISQARLLSVSTRESGSWLHALPSSSLGNRLDDDSLRVAVALRLGASICAPHICPCGKLVDILGHHGLSCNRSAGRRPRHEAINEVIRRALVSAGVPAILEPSGVCRNDGKRPDGMSLIPWRSGKAMVWDATCVDTLATSHLLSTAYQKGAAAIKAEQKKASKYSCLTDNYIFIPFAVETLGAWGPQAIALTHEIGRRIRCRTGERRAYEFLVQSISVAIQRGNAASVLASIPRHRDLHEIFYLQ
jgi:hypothetical protein